MINSLKSIIKYKSCFLFCYNNYNYNKFNNVKTLFYIIVFYIYRNLK